MPKKICRETVRLSAPSPEEIEVEHRHVGEQGGHSGIAEWFELRPLSLRIESVSELAYHQLCPRGSGYGRPLHLELAELRFEGLCYREVFNLTFLS